MKVKLEIELDLPEGTNKLLGERNECLPQLLFDEYINYATVQHMSDAVKWCAKGRVGSENEDAGAKIIFQHHQLWGEICANAKWKIIEGDESSSPDVC